MSTSYPTDIVIGDNWSRIHRGHGLDYAVLTDDLNRNRGTSQGRSMVVDEVYLKYVPRIKRCDTLGFPCDSEGEWHAHWVDVKPAPGHEFTITSWSTEQVAR